MRSSTGLWLTSTMLVFWRLPVYPRFNSKRKSMKYQPVTLAGRNRGPSTHRSPS